MSKQDAAVEHKPAASPDNSPAKLEIEADANPLLDEKEIAVLAYRRWVEKGCPQQNDQEDWFEAERELRLRISNGQ
ncbi:MAG: DUF2934 domain-containing protein [Acidobacteriia bacterium]|nr:DUF2934 domain-containing protein [Terriglobia bacterium]